MNSWTQTGFDWELTADGTPTLRVLGGGESMHHSGGALSETEMIYGSTIKEGFSLPLNTPRILSVGLGLGYVEFLTAAASLKANKDFRMVSLEASLPLVRAFQGWLDDSLVQGEIREGLDQVAQLVAQQEGVHPESLKGILRSALDSGAWVLGGVLYLQQFPIGTFHIILYDIFASKTYPEFWSEEYLKSFLSHCAATDFCLFSTFACTGNLRRALTHHEFKFIKRSGFKGTRNSTLGRRIPTWPQ